MSSNLLEQLLNGYGLIQGQARDIAYQLCRKEKTGFTGIAHKRSKNLLDMLSFLNSGNPDTKFAVFQHSPGWAILISNNKEGFNFINIQDQITRALNCRTIAVKDTPQEVLFRMLDEMGSNQRTIIKSAANGKSRIKDSGQAFPGISTKTEFSQTQLSELINIATGLGLTHGQKLKQEYYLLEIA